MKLTELLVEGGQALKGVSKITQAEVKGILKDLLRLISESLKIKLNDIRVIGSAGKKPLLTDLSGDIDIAVQCDPEIIKQNLNNLAKAGQFKEMPGINVYSFAYELPSGKLVQVDLMPVQNVKFAEWSFQANPHDLELGLKGAQRNELFFAIAKFMPSEILEKTPDGKPLKVKRYFYDLNQGLMQGTKSYKGKKGNSVKTGRTIEKVVITNDPVKVAQAMFGKNVKPHQVSNFNDTLTVITGDDFLFKSQLSVILNQAQKGIQAKGLKMPSTLTVKI